jgi:signal transduction histidine kinase/CheY-like chemotaxis protein/ligand-binding sensor domain-containing protein/AraC-like DNA-binding protein
VNPRPHAHTARSAPGVVLIFGIGLAPASATGQSTIGTDVPSPDERPLVHQYWGIEDGLPLSHVNAVLATSQGYLWLATYDGLVRFDGARFTTFNAANEPDLPTSRFVSIHEDDDGALWALAEFDHVVRFAEGRFRAFPVPDDARGAALGGLLFGGGGTIWIGTNRGLFSVGEHELVPAQGTEGIAVSQRPHVAADGAVWFANDGRGAVRWHDGEIESFIDEQTVLGRTGRGFAGAPGGGTYFATGTSVMERRGETVRRLAFPGAPPQISRLIPMAEDSALVVTNAGLLALVGGEISVLHGDISTPTAARASTLRDERGGRWFATDTRLFRNGRLVYDGAFPIAGLALDHEGSVWIAADGLHRFKPSLFEIRGDAEGEVSNVYPIFEDSRKRVWIGGLSGGFGWFENGEFHRLPPQLSRLPQAIAEDRDGRIWVGLISYGGCVLEGEICPEENQFLPRHTIKALFRDQADSMWIGTDRGVYRESDDDWVHFSTSDGLPHNFVRVIRQSSDGAMWFGMNGGGIARFLNGEIQSLSRESGFPSDLVRAIHIVSPRVLLIGTEDSGLLRVALPDPSASLSEAEVLVLDRRVGIYEDGIHSIVSDGLGRLWMNTNRGIFWILESEVEEFASGERSRIRSIAYRESDGLPNPEGNGGVQSAAIRSSDGRLWFAMQSGVAILDPREIEGSEHPLPVLVEEVRIEGGRTLPAAGEDEAIVLDPGERNFEVAYTALGFLSPQNLRFQYRLSGFQPDWVDAADRRSAFFTNVPPGEYRFELRATREDGVWRDLQAPLLLAVKPFFHETLWFRSSLAASLILLGLTGVRVRERRRLTHERQLERLISERTATVEAQAAQLAEIDRTKSRFFANISHEFRTPLTLTIGPLEDLVSGQHGPLDPQRLAPLQLSLRNSRRLLKLVNQLMDVAKLEARAVEVRARKADLVPFLRDLLLAFAPLAEREGIRSRALLPDHPILLYFDPDLIERVLLNLLSNAFKFTPEGGTVALEAAERDDGWVTIAVRDSGPGIAEEQLQHLFDRFYQGEPAPDAFQAGTGIGLSLARELVALHGGRLEVESDPGFGSTFTAWLPTGRDHLAPEQIRNDTESRSGLGPLVAEELALLETAVGPSAAEHRASTATTDRQEELDEDVPIVLIVEDNVDVAAFVRSRLEPKFRCLEARDGEAALKLTRERLPDIVISDVMMPRMDGIELLKALRADRDLAYVPVLLLTAKADQEAKLEGLEAGAAAYLTKPFDSAELEARVEGLIEQQRVLRERLLRESLLHPSKPDVLTPGDQFLVKLRETIEANLADEDFDVRALARAMSESRSSLYRHIHDLIGETPSQVLKRMRLERAEAMLTGGAGSIQQIAYAVGYKSVSHFSRSFREHYGAPPSRYTGEE